MSNRNVEVINGDIFSPSSAPGSPTEGQVYYDSSTHALRYRNATTWVDCGVGSSLTPEAWTDATYATGWTNLSANNAAAYMKDPFGFVHIRGTVYYTSGGSTTIFTLPSGYRPATKNQYFTAYANGAMGQIKIDTSGVVSLAVGTGTSMVCLDGINFDIR